MVSHLLHEYIADQLAQRVRKSRAVVWYDPRSEFQTFVSELGGEPTGAGLRQVSLGGSSSTLAVHDGSLYSLRARIEPLFGGDEPQPLVLYLPGTNRDLESSVLMEIELAGCRWEPQLRQLARNALRQRYTDGVIDELLGRDRLTYDDLVSAAAVEGATAPSVLKQLLRGATSEAQLASWLADSSLDAAIEDKEARVELARLVRARIGIELPADNLTKWRSITARRVLGIEFRSDLAGEPPPQLDVLGQVTGEIEQNIRSIARALRKDHPVAYTALADRAEHELALTPTSVDPLALGSIDTFRFEEQALLGCCAALIAGGEFAHALELSNARTDSFWLSETVERQAQWEAIRLAAQLGVAVESVEAELAHLPHDAQQYVERYASTWYTVDRAQRQFEAWLSKLEDDPDERTVVSVRQRYDAAVSMLVKGFATALQHAGWVIDGQLQQTEIYDDIVQPMPGRVAYFLVDALRYEMGADLAERLSAHGEVTIRPAIGVLPSITPTGMAALMSTTTWMRGEAVSSPGLVMQSCPTSVPAKSISPHAFLPPLILR
jgi:hypothetical protein